MFRHFKSKDELAASLFEACYRRLAFALSADGLTLQTAIERSLDLIGDSPESVHFVLENIRRYWRGLPEELRLRSIPGSVRRLIEAEQAAGHVRTDVNGHLASALVVGTLGQVARMAHFKELSKPPGDLAASLYSLIIHGIGV